MRCAIPSVSCLSLIFYQILKSVNLRVIVKGCVCGIALGKGKKKEEKVQNSKLLGVQKVAIPH